MDGVEIYPEEYVKPLLYSLQLLKRGNVLFPRPNVSLMKTYWPLFYMIPFLTVHYVTMTLYLVKLGTEGLKPFENVDMIPIWLITTEVIMKNILFFLNRTEIRGVVAHLGSVWRTEGLTNQQRKIKQSAIKRLNFTQFLIGSFSLAVSWQYFIVPLCDTVIRRLILKQDVELRLPLACVYPFEITNWYRYLAVYAFQMYCIFRIVYVYVGAEWILVALTSQLTTHFLILQEDLLIIKPENRNKRANDFVEEVTEERSDFGIKAFIIRHQEALLVTNKLNASFNKQVFLNLLFATLGICFFAVAAKASTGAYVVNHYGAILALLMNILLICYSSEMLSTASAGISDAAAKSSWLEGDLIHRGNILFIIMRSQHPCSLMMLYDMPIGLSTFKTVLKKTWSYFCLASQIYDRRG